MASYTMPLSNYIEMWSQDNETISTRDAIEQGRPKLFDFDYPIFDTNYKKVFETHFIRNFYHSEIGFETEGLFKFKLENWLSINMPYYNKMFESELISFDPLSNTKIDVTTNKTNDKNVSTSRDSTQTGTTTGESTSTSSQDSNGSASGSKFERDLESETPEGRLTITASDGVGLIEYASDIKENKGTSSQTSDSHIDGTATDNTSASSNATVNDTGTSEINETEDYIESRLGKIGSQSYSSMLMEYRDTFIRIEKKIFDEVRKELFMLVY